jgi:hypothetical protein
MVDESNQVDSFVIPGAASVREVMMLWRKVMEIPDDRELEFNSHNDQEHYWGFKPGKPVIP